MKRSCILVLASVLLLLVGAAPPIAAFDPDNAFLSVNLEGFIGGPNGERGSPNRLNLYMVRVGGKWISGVGTVTNNGRPNWNLSLMPTDPSALTFDGKRLAGRAVVVLAPDAWMPVDHKVRTAFVTLDATVVPEGGRNALAGFTGTWSSRIDEDAAVLTTHRLFAKNDGKLVGGIGRAALPNVAGEASYDLTLTGLIPGDGKYPASRRVISLGVQDGRAISARLAMMDNRHAAYDFQEIASPDDLVVQADGKLTLTHFAPTD